MPLFHKLLPLIHVLIVASTLVNAATIHRYYNHGVSSLSTINATCTTTTRRRPKIRTMLQRQSLNDESTILSMRGGADVAAAATAASKNVPVIASTGTTATTFNHNMLLLIFKDLIAKSACIFFMGQSSTAWLAPHRTCLKYGLTTSVLNVACNRKLATAYLGATVIMYGMLFQHCTAETAIGASAVVWMMEQLKARLWYEAEDTGRPIIGEYIIGAIATVTAAATLLWKTTTINNYSLSVLAMKISALLLILNGMSFFIAPATMCKFWKVPVGDPSSCDDPKRHREELKRYSETVFLHRYMGVALIFSGILQAVLAWGRDIYQAIGYAFSYLFMVNCWSFLKTSDFKRLARVSLSVSSKIDLKKRLSKLFFPMFNAVVASTLLLTTSGSGSHGENVVAP